MRIVILSRLILRRSVFSYAENADLLLEGCNVKSEHGFFAFNTHESGTDIEMNGNNFENLFRLGPAATQKPLKSFKLKTTDNSFDGITHIYFRNLQQTSPVFSGNIVRLTRHTDQSVMYRKYTGNDVRYHFDSITVKNNTFRNTYFGTIKNVPGFNKVVRGN